ncbi:MAG: DUF4838 domain-containing protein [Clostridia bacterium]|nr:DUF4838 domain-containing protein [Clostridia bacterium]
MKKAIKLTALSLATLSFATIGLTACDLLPGTGVETKEPEVNPEYVYNGTHIYTAPDTDEYLVKNGKTEYALVIPETTTYEEGVAVSEFTHLFKKATKIDLTVYTDDQVTDASKGKYISLGRTTLLEDSDIKVDYNELDQDGHKIVTKDDDIYLCGGMDTGTVFAVYTFMNLTFNYETYTYNTTVIEETWEKKLKAYDVLDIPDFKTRAHSSDITTYVHASDYDINMYPWRLRYRGKEATRGMYYMRVHEVLDDFTSGSSASTNARRWFPESLYKDAEGHPDTYHPSWFSTNGGEQLCFSARGDAAEYEAMVDLAFRKVESHLKYYTPAKAPNANIITLTHEDNVQYCTCEKCVEISKYYGNSQAAVQILFMNDLAERVDALLNANKDKEWYREDFKLLFFAYNHNYTPPAKYDPVKKEYVPIDDEIICHDRLIAWFATNINGQIGFDEGLNAAQIGVLKGWGAVAKNIQFWSYNANFRNYMFGGTEWAGQYATDEMYGFFCNQSDLSWFTQMQDHNDCPNTAWAHLNVYLDSKKSWNTSLKTMDLVKEYMEAVYKEGADAMYQMWLSERLYRRGTLIEELQLVSNGDGGVELSKVEYWPLGMLQGWIGLADQALEAVEIYKESDPELYDQICRNIEIEAVGKMYILMELHRNTLSKEDRQAYVERLQHDMQWLDISSMWVKTKSIAFADWLAEISK